MGSKFRDLGGMALACQPQAVQGSVTHGENEECCWQAADSAIILRMLQEMGVAIG
jgi:hypothetical protein